MRERLIELWLDSAKERSFQFPFAASLAAEGYTVLHVTRHCAMEFGKDIVARDAKGGLHAYQLKDANGAKITQEWWRREIEPQWAALCDSAVVHAGVTPGTPHKPWIVINGELNEEVHHLIAAKNQLRPRARRVGVIVRGELIDRIKSLGTSFWPESDSVDYTPLLEIFLSEGSEMFPKEKLASLLSRLVIRNKGLSKPEAKRLITSVSVLTALVLDRFQKRENHYAEFEAWIVCIASALHTAEKAKLPSGSFSQQISLLVEAALGALERLCDEIIQNEGCSQGSPFTDCKIRDVRITVIAGALSVYGMWRTIRGEPRNHRDIFIEAFTKKCISKMKIPGECTAPAFLALALYRGVVSAQLDKEFVLLKYLASVISSNLGDHAFGLPNPYYSYDASLLRCMGLDEDLFKESFAGNSYSVKAFFDLLVRLNLKQRCRYFWPDYTRITQEEFVPKSPLDMYNWKSENGVIEVRMVPRRQNWETLRTAAAKSTSRGWPRMLLKDPGFVLAFCLVYPHRLNANIARWLDSKW